MQFDFGQNWADYSATAVTPQRVARAREDFLELMAGIELQGKSFLDIGFGQGFALLTATAAGARTLGCDINPKCGEVLRRNQVLFPELLDCEIQFHIGSILDASTVKSLQSHPLHGRAGFDIVHSWGVLHHTGDMRRALANAAALLRPGGHLVIAIYNRHWSSRAWLWIKWAYCKSPTWVQKTMVGLLYPVIWLAKFVATRRNPLEKERGMDFFFDVIDWVGGYPYEYADVAEMETLCLAFGLTLVRARKANVPTGCNEFVFQREFRAR